MTLIKDLSDIPNYVTRPLADEWTIAYNKRPVNLNISGSTLKTVSLFLGDGSILSSQFSADVDVNNYTTAVSFDTSSGILTTSRSGLSDLTTPLDGRYVQPDSVDNFTNKTGNISQWTNDIGYLTSYSETDTLHSVVVRGNVTSFPITTNSHTINSLTNESALVYSWSGDTKWKVSTFSGSTGLYWMSAASVIKMYLDTTGNLTAQSFIKSGGTTFQFLKADGSIDSNGYTVTGRTLTVNGLTQDLSTDRTWTITTTGTADRISVIGGSGLTPTINIANTYVGQSSITTLGTITTGVWQGTVIDDLYLKTKYLPLTGGTLTGGLIGTTGNFSSSVTASSHITSGGSNLQFVKGDGSLDNTGYTPTGRTLTINGSAQTLGADRTWTITTTGTANKIDVSGGNGLNPTITISSSYIGQSSITTVGTIGSGTWQGSVIGSSYGGAGAVSGILKANGSGTVSAAVGGTDYEFPLTFSSPLNRSSNTISIQVATSGQNGYLSASDWGTFNGKQAALSGSGIVKSASGTISYITGSSSQFVKADGSLDSNSYITIASIGNGTLSMGVSGGGLSGSASFTANQSGGSTFTVTSNGTASSTVSTLVMRDSAGDINVRLLRSEYTGDNGNGNYFLLQNDLSTDNYARPTNKTTAMTVIRGVASGSWGINVTGTAGSETLGTVTSRGASTSTFSTFSGGARVADAVYLDSNYGNTLVGAYSSSVYQGIFAMGNAYRLPADGSTSGSLYGLAWSYPHGGQSANLASHGMLLMINGVTQAALSSNLWINGGDISGVASVYATNHYYAGNTAYGFIGANVYADTVNGTGSDTLELNYYSGGEVWVGASASKILRAANIYSNGVQVVYNSGTWGISITGSADSATYGRYVYNNNSYGGGAGYMEASAVYVVGARTVYNNGAYSGSGWVEPSDLGVRYANSAGSASSASLASTVTINYNNDSNSTYQMLWGSSTSVYGTAGIYCNPAADAVYATDYYATSGYFRNYGDAGVYNQDYGNQLRRSVSASHGSWEIFGYNKGGYAGLNIIDPQGYYNNFMFESGNGGWYKQNGKGDWCMYYAAATDTLALCSDVTGSGYKLQVNGTAFFTSVILAGGTIQGSEVYRGSARILKEDFKTWEERFGKITATDLLRDITIWDYSLKADENKLRKLSFIADETHEAFATINHDVMDQGSSIAVLIKGSQESDQRITELENEIKELKNLINQLIK